MPPVIGRLYRFAAWRLPRYAFGVLLLAGTAFVSHGGSADGASFDGQRLNARLAEQVAWSVTTYNDLVLRLARERDPDWKAVETAAAQARDFVAWNFSLLEASRLPAEGDELAAIHEMMAVYRWFHHQVTVRPRTEEQPRPDVLAATILEIQASLACFGRRNDPRHSAGAPPSYICGSYAP